MKSWQPTQAQVQTWEEKGYFTVYLGSRRPTKRQRCAG